VREVLDGEHRHQGKSHADGEPVVHPMTFAEIRDIRKRAGPIALQSRHLLGNLRYKGWPPVSSRRQSRGTMNEKVRKSRLKMAMNSTARYPGHIGKTENVKHPVADAQVLEAISTCLKVINGVEKRHRHRVVAGLRAAICG